MNKVERHAWYRVIGYRSAYQALIMAGVLVYLLIDKTREGKLGSWEGLLIVGVTAGVVGVAIWDYLDWRAEQRAAREEATKKSTT